MRILSTFLLAVLLAGCVKTPDLEISLKQEGEYFNIKVTNQTGSTLKYSPQLIWTPKRFAGDFDLLITDSKGSPISRCGIVDAPAGNQEVQLAPGDAKILREGTVVVWAAYCLKPNETYRVQLVYRKFPENIPGPIEFESNLVSLDRQN